MTTNEFGFYLAGAARLQTGKMPLNQKKGSVSLLRIGCIYGFSE
jgi:hypothetical protein